MKISRSASPLLFLLLSLFAVTMSTTAPIVQALAGTITEYTVPFNKQGESNRPYIIITGSDGNLWFTDFYTDKIGRMTPTGTYKAFKIPTKKSEPYGIAIGIDKNLWFTEQVG